MGSGRRSDWQLDRRMGAHYGDTTQMRTGIQGRQPQEPAFVLRTRFSERDRKPKLNVFICVSGKNQ